MSPGETSRYFLIDIDMAWKVVVVVVRDSIRAEGIVDMSEKYRCRTNWPPSSSPHQKLLGVTKMEVILRLIASAMSFIGVDCDETPR